MSVFEPITTVRHATSHADSMRTEESTLMAIPALSPTTYRLTAEDVDGFPIDGKRRELIHGALFVASVPSRWHQRALIRLSLLTGNLVKRTSSGELYRSSEVVRFTDRDVVQPDVMYIQIDRLHLYQGRTVVGSPGRIVEVGSPSNRGFDLVEQMRLYETRRVPEYWATDPELRAIRQLVLHGSSHVAVVAETGMNRSTAIDGLEIDPAEVYAPFAESAEDFPGIASRSYSC